jgi:hypothetical protein
MRKGICREFMRDSPRSTEVYAGETCIFQIHFRSEDLKSLTVTPDGFRVQFAGGSQKRSSSYLNKNGR